MRRQLAHPSDQPAIPVDLARIIHRRQKDRQLRLRPWHRGKVDVPPIPGVSGVALMPLQAPGLAGQNAIPGRVVQRRGGPRRVVAQVKLPCPVQRSGRIAQPLHHQRRCRRSSMQVKRSAKQSEKNEGPMPLKNEFSHNARIIPLESAPAELFWLSFGGVPCLASQAWVPKVMAHLQNEYSWVQIPSDDPTTL